MMMKNYLTVLMLFLFYVAGLRSQVTTDPSPLQEDSENVKIYFHADQGNRGLMGVGPNTEIYAHTGACLSNGQEWVNAPDWNTNLDKYKMIYVSENLWELYIGDIRQFYGITNPSLTITKLAFVFRSGDRTKEGKGQGNTDIFVDVVDSGLQIALEANFEGFLVTPSTGEATFKATTTVNADISIAINGNSIGTGTSTKLLTATYSFTHPGDYDVTATATANGETVSVTKKYCYVEDSKQAAYPGGKLQMGPVKNEDGSVTFCLGAPEKKSVILVGAWNDYVVSNDYVMNYTDTENGRYFWITVSGLDNDRMYGYYFVVDGIYQVGDPYARLVLDPYNDKYLNTGAFTGLPSYPEDKIQNVPLAIYQGSINDYNWIVTDFKGVVPENLIIYELLFRDFTGTEGKANGNGTVKLAIDKIPYIKSLGFNAIELLPIMEFNGNISWGYNPNFYFAVDKAYGTPDDYKRFIDVCHQNDIAVILDMVFNQSDGLHPWYQMYQAGQNPFYNLDAPHAYSVLNDWNQDNPMLQEHFCDILRYWMEEYKFDGFRFDLVKGLGNNESYANNGMAATDAYNQSRVLRMRAFQKVMDEINPDAYFINENLALTKEENEMAETGQLNWANINNAGCQFAMGYPSESNLDRMFAPEDGGRTWGSTVSYLESHDEQRLAYKQDQWGVNGVKGNVVNSMHRLGAAAAQMFMAPGAHMVWQFSEMGNAQNTKTAQGNDTDPKIVNWSLLDEPNHKGLVDNYRELIYIRNGNPELFSKDAEFNNACGETDWADGRTLSSKYKGQELYTIINPNVYGDLQVSISFDSDDDSHYQILSKSYDTNPTFSAAGKTVNVPANCYVVIGSVGLSEVDKVASDVINKIKVRAGKGGLEIGNLNEPAYIYSLDGKVISVVDKEGSVAVVPGIYIVRSATEAIKVLVE